MRTKINTIEEFKQAEKAMLEQLMEQLKREGFFELGDTINPYDPLQELKAVRVPKNEDLMQWSILGDKYNSSFSLFQPQSFQRVSFSDNLSKNKLKSKKAAKPVTSYKWEPNMHKEPLPSVLDPNGFTPEGAHIEGWHVKKGFMAMNHNIVGNESGPNRKRAENINKESKDKIGNAATDLEVEWKKSGVTYDESHPDRLKVEENAIISDCVTFVAEAFAKAGYSSIFGTIREYPQTTDMLKRMYFLTFGQEVPKDITAKTKKEKAVEAAKEIEEAKKALTVDNPETGDIMMWKGHVAIITDIDEKAGTFNYVQMGVHGASKSWKAIHYKNQEQMKDDITATSGIPSSEFWGFWKPKAP